VNDREKYCYAPDIRRFDFVEIILILERKLCHTNYRADYRKLHGERADARSWQRAAECIMEDVPGRIFCVQKFLWHSGIEETFMSAKFLYHISTSHNSLRLKLDVLRWSVW